MKRIFKYLFMIGIVMALVLAIPEMRYRNQGKSISKGSVWNGGLDNAYLLPYNGPNFKYFSWISYYLLDNGYTHSSVYHTVMDAYAAIEKEYPDKQLYLMECSDRYGGRLGIHRTHQNGMSIDFMVPKKGKGLQYNDTGFLHYLLDFDDDGRLLLNKKVSIDFELMAQHVLALETAARKNNMRIKKVILKTDLQDELFASPSGPLIKDRDIYFVRRLPYWTNRVHDDHYHVDFEFLNDAYD